MAEPVRKQKAAKGREAPSGRKSAKSPVHPSKDLVNCQLMKALSHTERVQVLAILAERIASPKEMAKELGEEVPKLSYHVRVLKECGLIVQDHTAQQRGAIEHFYRSVTPTIIPTGTWDSLPPALQQDVAARILRDFFEDASESLEAGAFANSSGELSLTPLILDRSGVEAIEQLSKDFLEAVFKVQKETSGRLQGKNDDVRNATAATVFLASFLSARSPQDGKKASATKRR